MCNLNPPERLGHPRQPGVEHYPKHYSTTRVLCYFPVAKLHIRDIVSVLAVSKCLRCEGQALTWRDVVDLLDLLLVLVCDQQLRGFTRCDNWQRTLHPRVKALWWRAEKLPTPSTM